MKKQQRPNRKHALVIGASMAGLLAARVLSDYFEQVTVIERDQLPEAAQTRKGVPQGQQTHLLLRRGVEILDELFPDLYPALEAEGAPQIDAIKSFHWFHFGVWKLQFASSMRLYGQSRPALEYHVRRRVAARPNVRILDGTEVLGLVGEARDSAGISGVRLRRHQQIGSEGFLETDLVVDASGRGSQTPRWLSALGYPEIEEARIKINVGYASRVYRCSSTLSNSQVLGLYPWPLEMKRLGYLAPIEGNACFAMLAGYLNDHPPADEEGFLAFARSLSTPDLYEVIKDAEPLGPIVPYKFPANQRRYYERSRQPDGLVVIGDALCSFNPINAQGMTVAAMEARALRDCLQQQLRLGTMSGFSRRFQRAAARVADIPWLLTTGEDLRYPEIEGRRPFGMRMLQRYVRRVSYLTATNPFVTRTFYEVLHMRKPPTALFHPRILLPALLTHPATSVTSG